MIIYTNGCSHTAGHNVDWKTLWPNFTIRSIIGQSRDSEYQINPPIDNIKKKNVLYNDSIKGAGNDYIFHTSLETLSKLIQENKKPDYAFIQWSGPNRRLHCHPNGTYIFINPHDNTELGIKFEPMGSQHTIHYIFCMQEFLKKNNINYCFLNFMALDESIKKLNIYKEIDLDKFLYIEYDNEILFNGILSHLKKEEMTLDNGGHANNKGNVIVANELLKKLKFKELIFNKLC